MRFPLLLGLCLFVSSVLAPTAKAQTISEVASWLKRDTAGLLEIHDVRSAYEKLKRLPAFQLDRWMKIAEELESGENPILDSDRIDALLRAVEELDHLIPDAEEFHIALHDADQNLYTVFMRADEATLDEIQSNIQAILDAVFGKIDADDENEDAPKDKQEQAQLDFNRLNRIEAVRRWGELHRHEEWLIFSNSQDFLVRVVGIERRKNVQQQAQTFRTLNYSSETPNDLDIQIFSTPSKFRAQTPDDEDDNDTDTEIRSLADDRAYQTIRKRSLRISPDEDSIAIYLKPERLNAFFPNYSQTEWKGYFNHELPAAGINILINDEPDSVDEPMLIADANILFTRPRQGRSLMIKQYKPVDIPYLTVKPVELMAFARDEEKFAAESLRCYDGMFGENSADEWLKNRFSNDERDYFTDCIPRRKSYYEMKFKTEIEAAPSDQTQQETQTGKKEPKTVLGLLRMEQIKDHDAFQRYFDGMIKEVTQVRKHTVEPYPESGVEVWRLSEKEAESRVGIPENNTHYLHADNFTLDSYLLGQEWYVEGEWPQTMTQLDHLENHQARKRDYGKPIRELMDDLLDRTDDSDPFMIKYYEPHSWQPKIDQMGSQMNVSQIAWQDTGVIQLSQNKSGNPGVYRLQSVQLEDFNRRIVEQLKEQRTQSKWKRLVAKNLASLFGRQLYLYTQSDEEIRVVLGCYPMRTDSEQDPE